MVFIARITTNSNISYLCSVWLRNKDKHSTIDLILDLKKKIFITLWQWLYNMTFSLLNRKEKVLIRFLNYDANAYNKNHEIFTYQENVVFKYYTN